jgi:site-specific DNA-methyltransferase (adenine-specific)
MSGTLHTIPFGTTNALLLCGDCLEELQKLPNDSVDCIIDDLPYGVTNKSSEAGTWDKRIPLKPLFSQFLRVAKIDAPIILFSQGMFTADLMKEMPHIWRYNLIWDKCRSSGFLNANRMPLRGHEDICIFYRKLPTYHPQMVKAAKGCESHTRGKAQNNDGQTNRCYGKFGGVKDGDLTMKFPSSILRYPRPHCNGNHPTEKSVALCEWLVRTYTDEDDVVLDATMGSGTTGVAAIRANRRFIGIEMSRDYFAVARSRIEGLSMDTNLHLSDMGVYKE